jgi:hypothetical protein
MPQDMPPTGGYEPVQYRRNLPVRGFRPAYYLVAVAGICSYGFYRVGQGNRSEHYVRCGEELEGALGGYRGGNDGEMEGKSSHSTNANRYASF